MKWERVFGEVKRGKKFTIFRVEVRIGNGTHVYQAIRETNQNLEAFPGLYGFILDKMVDQLEKRISERA